MNLDEIIDRNEYPTFKWDKKFLAEHFGTEEAIPMAVADMDLKAPPAVIEQLNKRVAHGIFGYGYQPESYFSSLQNWYSTRHDWMIDRQHIESAPSVLSAISILINENTNSGDGVIIQPPVYPQFQMVIGSNGRKIINNSLLLSEGRYEIDFDDLETKASDPANKILILCNPHNPVGRVWTKPELEKIAEISIRHGVFVIADEVHGDFAFSPHRYIPYLSISEQAAENAAACLSPAKTFNISGMVDAITVIPNEQKRRQFNDFTQRHQINKLNVLSSVAAEAAYNDGADWLDSVSTYVQENIQLIRNILEESDAPISLIEPEGTFLTWLDFRKLGMAQKDLETFLAHEAKVSLGPGRWFGSEGEGFARMAIGCPRATVRQAFENLITATNSLRP